MISIILRDDDNVFCHKRSWWWWWRINWKQRRWPILYNGALITLRLASAWEVTMCHGVAAWVFIMELMVILITCFSCYHVILCISYTLNQILTGRTMTPGQAISVDVIQTSLRSAIFETSWETKLWILTPSVKSKFDQNTSSVANQIWLIWSSLWYFTNRGLLETTHEHNWIID